MEGLPPPPPRPDHEPAPAEPQPEPEPEPEPEPVLTKKQKKAAAKEVARLEAEAGVSASPRATASTNDPKVIWEGLVQTEEDKKGKLKFVKTYAVVYDGGMDTGVGWRPRLEIYEKEKDRSDDTKEPLHTIDLNSALIGPDKEEEKGRAVFSVLDANGTLLVKLKALKKSDDEVKEWTARIESVAQPSETFNAAAAFSKEEEEAVAAEAAAAKEMEDIVVAQGVLKHAEDKVEELKVELADVENLKQEAADDPTLLAEIVAEIGRLCRELSEAEAAVAHAKSELQREIEEAATAEKIAHKERAEAEEAQENYSKVRTAAEQHAAEKQYMLAHSEEQGAGDVGSTAFDELPRAPEERRSYLQWLFQHKYDEENRGSIETSLVEHVLYDVGIVPRSRRVAPYLADLLVKGGRYRDGVSDVLLASIAHQQEAIHDAELLIAKEGKASFMARNLELKLKDDIGKLPPDAPEVADLRAQMAEAANKVHAAEDREEVAKRARIVAEEELRKLKAEEAEDRISFAEFDPWFSEHEALLFDEEIRSLSVYNETIRSAIMHFQKYDTDLVGELPPQEFRLMCESMGWEPEDIEESVEMMRRTDDGRISLPHFVSWYTDDGMIHNVFAAFDRDDDQKLHFDEFAELCEHQSTVQLRPDDVQELFNSYDCTQSAAASSDDSLPVGEWLEGVGFPEYAEAFVSQGFDTLASIRGAGLDDADLRDIGVGKLRHRKAILSLVSQEGYLQPQDLKRLFLKAQQSKVNREQLQLQMQGQLERWLPAEEQYRDGTRWKQCYVTVWLAGAAAKLTVYENEETFKQLCENVIVQWVEEPPQGSQPGLRPGVSMELIHASAAAVVTRQTPSGPQDVAVPHGAISAEHRLFVVEDRKNGRKMKFRMSSSQSLLKWVRTINDVAVRGTAGYEEVEARIIGGRRTQQERRERHNHSHHHHHHNSRKHEGSSSQPSRSKSRAGVEHESGRHQGNSSRRRTTSRSSSNRGRTSMMSHANHSYSNPSEGYPPPSAASSPVSDSRRRSRHGGIAGTPRDGVRGMGPPMMPPTPGAFDAARQARAQPQHDPRRRSRHGGGGTPRGVTVEQVSFY